MTATALTFPRAAPQPARRVPQRVPLRVVEVASRRSRRQRRHVTLVASAITIALFTVVAFHVVLAQSQISIDRVERQTVLAQRHYEDLRLDRARLSSPERIVQRAAELGLVAPNLAPAPIIVTGPLPPRPGATP